MKNLILILLFSFNFLYSIKGCESADQYRLFPLGSSFGKIICLELDQFRDNGDQAFVIEWEIRAKLIYYSPDGKSQLISDLGTHKTEDDKYTEFVRSLLEKANSEMQFIPGVKNFNIQEIGFADYPKSLNEFSIQYKNEMGYINNRKIVIPHTFRKRAYILLDVKSKDVLSNSELQKKHAYFINKLGIGSVRKYQNSEMSFSLICLGYGEENSSVKNPLKKEEVTLEAVYRFMYNEPVLHHGHSFDIILL